MDNVLADNLDQNLFAGGHVFKAISPDISTSDFSINRSLTNSSSGSEIEKVFII